MIDVFGYMKDLSNKTKFESKSFEEVKKDLAELHEYKIIFEDLEKSSLFEAENSMHINNDVFIKSKLLISNIKDKQEISERLSSLNYSIGWLRAAVLIKDKSIISKAIKTVLENKYSSINAIISELNSLKNDLDKLEKLHTGLLKSGLSLDIKTLLEQDFRKKHEKLAELHNKQKNILLSLSSIFINLAKGSVLNNQNK